ncbi:hypothetical protein P280DRAFT_334035 [Massarina eburnea CBS 473.64]|uniref:HD/PDEase domain-containing protein n=1 Tax=Massarina eburnea CBS 473.64 TaxID=1395130 RepID=A0A6A6S3G9_9PLEO|nr:hypothetical protein P280DRAFT_334035 [Massarina eburnea CBS 473.64]
MSTKPPLPNLPIPASSEPLFTTINTFVHTYMSSPAHDSSHDYQHILRVVSNAHLILRAEQSANPTLSYDTTALFLAAFLHDVGDHKYVQVGEDPANQVSQLLLSHGVAFSLAERVQAVVRHVSYTHELRNPRSVADVLRRFPELGVVQDADRLDAIGAVGVARCFAYAGAKRKGEPMAVAIDHFNDKLLKLPGLMKTGTGRRLAEKRMEVLVGFAKEFNEEARLSFDFR